MAAYRREIEAADDPEGKRIEIEERLDKVCSSVRTAEAFGVEELIDPRDTRPLLCEWVEEAYRVEATRLGVRQRSVRP